MRDYRLGRLKGRWVVIWNEDDGRRRRYRLAANTRQEAEKEARELILFAQAPESGVTISQAWAAYQEDMGERRQASKLAQVGKNVLPVFGHFGADQITVEDCRAYIATRRAKGRKDGTIRTEMNCLRATVKWAEKRGFINAAPHIELPQMPPPRSRYLTREEASALILAAVDPHIQLAILLMLTTAGRIGALLELTWDRVDLERRVIKLAKDEIGPKKGRATVPINNTLITALHTAQTASVSPFVIEWGGRSVGSIKTGFNAAVKRAGIEHCTPHDLRRTAGRFMVEAGVPIEEVASYLGHSNPSVTRSTYAQFSPDYLRRAAGALDLGLVEEASGRGKAD